MAGLGKAAFDGVAMHDAAHRFAPESLAQGIEFRDQSGKHVVGVQQIDRDEMFGDQDFAKRGISVDAIAEQSAGKIMADPPCHDNSGWSAAPYRRRSLGKAQPSAQAQPGNGLADQWVDGTNLVACQGLNAN